MEAGRGEGAMETGLVRDVPEEVGGPALPDPLKTCMVCGQRYIGPALDTAPLCAICLYNKARNAVNYGRPSQQGLPSTFHPSEGVFPLISNKWGGESQLQFSAPAPDPPQIPYVDISPPRQPIPSSSTHNYIPLLEHVRTFSARRERPSPLSLSTVPPNKTPLSRSRAFTVSGPEVSGEVPPIGVKGSALPEDNTRYQLSPSPPDRAGFEPGRAGETA
ncbi:hypothetical protein DB88DRAFT_516832 [Papiliotrema laurentii]|uniref:Uncharacterized protein n=1 Tax=Papiliotrema laurentii TaxID=5418 RepID=A0AAD9FXC9_PAPLA|nr:hypothetical protein DB88DRAFT_516832 [Papiliotrema laurentii]